MDLTAITTPFGLLDRETQEALQAHGGPWEWWTGADWVKNLAPAWRGDTVYRVKPAPPKPREFWLLANVAFDSLEAALRARDDCRRTSPEVGFADMPIIRVREVLE